MFFYLGRNCPLKSMIQVSEDIFLDKGWTSKSINNKIVHYKGYSTECKLSENIGEIIDGYRPAGKWSAITQDKQVLYPKLRSFPIYTDGTIRTNIPFDNLTSEVYETEKIQRSHHKITLDEAAHKINYILTDNIHNFMKYNQVDRLRVLFSAGMDSLTVWSIVDNLSYHYDLYAHIPKGNISHADFFGVKQEYDSDLIPLLRQKFWGYKMTSCLNDKNWYTTGFYSERFQLREVSTGHAFANYYDKNLWEIPKETDYLYHFLQRSECKKNTAPRFVTESDLLDWCNESVYYDHQMWHIDNNLHFSPFFDIRITQVMNELSLEDIIHNALTAYIQKKIIEMNNSLMLSLVGDYKNAGPLWENFTKNFKNIQLKSRINEYITSTELKVDPLLVYKRKKEGWQSG